MKKIIAIILCAVLVLSAFSGILTVSAAITPVILKGDLFLDFDHGEVLYNSKPCILASDGKNYPVASWAFNRSASGSIVNGNYALCLKSTQNDVTTYLKAGAYPVNDGKGFYYLQPGADYTVTFDIKVASTVSEKVSPYITLGYGPVWSGSVWSMQSWSSCLKTVATLAQIPAGETYYTYTDENGDIQSCNIGGGYVRRTVKFTSPNTFPEPTSTNPLPNVLCFAGAWATGTDIAVDNIKIEGPAATALLVYENGEKEVIYGRPNEIINFDRAEGKEVTYPSGEGYSVIKQNWYYDENCENEVSYSECRFEEVQRTYYSKCEKVIDNTYGQVSFWGLEDGIENTLPDGFTKTDGGFNSNICIKANGNTEKLNVSKNATLNENATYNLTFNYKSSADGTVNINGENFSLKKSDVWTSASFPVNSGFGKCEISLNTKSEVYLDNFVCSKVNFALGVSALTDEAANENGAQALRVMFGYPVDESGKVVLGGNRYEIAERGILLSKNDTFTLESDGIDKFSKNSDFNKCWDINDHYLTYSVLIKYNKKTDNTLFFYRGYIKLTDGNVYYTEINSASLNTVLASLESIKKENTYSLSDTEVTDKMQFGGRYVLDGGVTLNHNGSSAEFKAQMGKTAKLSFETEGINYQEEINFALYVDGKAQSNVYTLTKNHSEFTVNINSSVGSHTVKLVRISDASKANITLKSITFNGFLTDLYAHGTLLEFVGDENASKFSYPQLTADMLNCDVRTFAYSGLNCKTAAENYRYENSRINDTEFICQRQADIVVIMFNGYTDVEKLISEIKDRSPKAKFIIITDEISTVSPDGCFVYKTKLANNLTEAGKRKLSLDLAEFIKENNLLNGYDTLIIEKRTNTAERKTRPVNFSTDSSFDSIKYYTKQADPEELLGKLPKGTLILDNTSLINQIAPNNGSGNCTFTKIEIDEDTVPYTEALRVKYVEDEEKTSSRTLYWNLFKDIPDGDFITVSFYARAVEGKDEAQLGLIGLLVEQTGENGWNKILNENVSVTPKWTKYYVSFKYVKDHPVFFLRWSGQTQVIDITGLNVVYYSGANHTIDDFPNNTSTAYLNEDAPWRKEAFNRIEQIRKGDINVIVKDKNGNVIKNADVSAEMYEHEFQFGNVTYENFQTQTKAQRYLPKYFNSAVIGNTFKWKSYESNPQLALGDLNLLNKLGIQNVRGHCMIWDGENLISEAALQNIDNEAELDRIIAERINSTINATRNRFVDWDILNEAVAANFIQTKYGRQKIKQWYEIAKAANSGADLYYNDYISDSRLFDLLDYMTENDVPFDGIGIQSHYGGAMDPEYLLDFYTKLSKYGKRLKITEYNMQCMDENLQAAFTRDFLITVFSVENFDGFYFWGMSGGVSNECVPFDDKWNPREALYQISDLIYNKFNTMEYGVTDENGRFSLRGYYGSYKISAVVNGVKKTVLVDCHKGNDNTVEITF